MSDMTDQVPPVEVSVREITELVRLFDESGWGSLELDIHGMHLVLGRYGGPGVSTEEGPVAAARVAETGPETARETAGVLTPQPAPSAQPEETVPTAAAGAAAPGPSAPAPSGVDLIEVRSPVVGSFWAAPSPGEPPFVKVGDSVTEGQQLAIVEVMKLMSDVSSPASGVVVEIAAVNAEMVEYDQVLFRIDPDVGADDA